MRQLGCAVGLSKTYGPFYPFSRGLADQQVALAVPNDLVAAFVQDATADPGDIDISVALKETGEVVAHAHKLGRDPVV